MVPLTVAFLNCVSMKNKKEQIQLYSYPLYSFKVIIKNIWQMLDQLDQADNHAISIINWNRVGTVSDFAMLLF